MRTSFTTGIVTASVLLLGSLASAAFPDGRNVITYWGQNSANSGSSQKNLAHYCDDSSDVLIISFITTFNVGGLPTLNVANACEGSTFDGTSLLKCDHIGKDIKTCQDKGKKILVSLGGASGSYGFASDSEGTTFAKTMWDLFGGGDSDTRPFGDAVVDGFDLDIEGGGPTGYAAFVKELRKLFKKDSSKDYYITAAPQCPFPDAMLGEVIDEVGVDAVNVQFYNNYCSTGGSNFNFDAWDEWAQNKSPNKNVKIFLGIPGSTSAAGSGYISHDDLEPVVEKVAASYKSFGGITIWDASQSYNNKDAHPDYAVAIAKIVETSDSENLSGDGSGSSKTTTTTRAPISTTTEASEPTSTDSATSTPTDIAIPTTTDDGAKETTTASTTTTTTLAEPTPGDDADDDNGADDDDSNFCVNDGDSCSEHGKYICTGDAFAVCNHGQWVTTQCAVGLSCMSTTDGGSIYCAQSEQSGSGSCSTKSARSSVSTKSAPRPYKSARVTAQLSVSKVDGKKYEAVFNARRLDKKAFGTTVVVEMKMPSDITIDKVENGKSKQNGQTVKLQVRNPNKKSMSLVFTIAGSIESGVFVAPDVNSMKFMT
ncbi:glycoside hydrolase superfamily [Fennellomyces sp. T-0311]|nr:glycoside hydrolase superfamily [Fennellomyces sp. T-0311]